MTTHSNRCLVGIHETGEIFESQNAVAEELGYSASKISMAITGIKPILGLTLYKIKDKRVCSKCKLIKDISQFYKRSWLNNLGNRCGHRGECKTCNNNQRRQFFKTHPELRREQHVKALYGLTQIEYNAILQAQHNKCAICDNKFVKTPNVDHDHVTGKVRGLLCRCCNMSLGGFRTKQNLERAIKYLEAATCRL